MVLEGLIKPLTAEKRPFELFFLGIIFSSVAIVLGLSIFSPHASIVTITLTSMVCIPIIYGVIKLEEKKSLEIVKESVLVKEHGRALVFFLFLFLGFVVSFSLWYVFLPEAALSEVFSVQTATISGVQDSVSGKAIGIGEAFSTLLVHNIKVLLFCLLFAVFYGFGAIFILTWNASVIGAAIGDLVRSNLDVGFFSAITAGMFKYMTHGIPEIIAYFTASLAGGIISIAVVNHDFKSPMFKHVIMDSLDLVLLSLVLLVAAAGLEVFVSPLL
jgi:uncharacterized membrane protein SpoIIM required for sporulation